MCSINSNLSACNSLRSESGRWALVLESTGRLVVREYGTFDRRQLVGAGTPGRALLLGNDGSWQVTNPTIVFRPQPVAGAGPSNGPYTMTIDDMDGTISVRNRIQEEVYTTAPVCARPGSWCTEARTVLKMVDCGDGGFRDWVCTHPDGRRGAITSSMGCVADDSSTGWPYAPTRLCPTFFPADVHHAIVSVNGTCGVASETKCPDPARDLRCGLIPPPNATAPAPAGGQLWQCDRILSPSRRFSLYVESGGNVVVREVYRERYNLVNPPLWSTNTNATRRRAAVFLKNGTWVVTETNGAVVWRSWLNTISTTFADKTGEALGPFRMQVGDDGIVSVLNRLNQEAWTTRRACLPPNTTWCPLPRTLWRGDCDGDGLPDAACRDAGGSQWVMLSTKHCADTPNAPNHACPSAFLAAATQDADPINADLIVSWRFGSLSRSLTLNSPAINQAFYAGDNAAARPPSAFESVVFPSGDGVPLPETATYHACLRRRDSTPSSAFWPTPP
ncbi:hypothetical protein HYH03_013637 [Edaphochlamys debaryana]|uniref:Bulb-type lectin domain-containing protein n=1 Tax=Edaphochlamys debaryana TaxID=47281 RepID=A0A835XRV0_9CHLO|nr:hypothetical protein HYH03_013637 [Edaphochlamys debaryana]|eukprot:KAG2487793.1 hypothetical protein HYH03_013637 [Edaphochlamys debaryana]